METYIVGDYIAFERQDGVSGSGYIRAINSHSKMYQVEVDEETKRKNRHRDFHNCNGYVKRGFGWNVDFCRVTELIEREDNTPEISEFDFISILFA